MVSRDGVSFQLRRAKGLLSVLLKNRMASIGVILLAVYGFMALGAPLLTPYAPYQPVSGSLAQPEWVMNFPDGYYLSKNLVVGQDPSFNSPSTLFTDWKTSSVNGSLTNLPIQVAYATNVSAPGDSGGSVRITNYGSKNESVTLSQTFNFTYNGPPRKFIASFRTVSSTAGPTTPYHIHLFITRLLDAHTFNLWNTNETFPSSWTPAPSQSLDTDADIIKKNIGASDTLLDPAALIFSAKSTYRYGIELTLSPNQTVYLDKLGLKLFGTAFGIFVKKIFAADIGTQLVYGSRTSVPAGLTGAGIVIGLGLLVGLMAGFFGKLVDELLMRFTDMMLVIPGLPLLIVLVAVLGQSILNVVIIIGFLGWMGFARIVRAQVLSLRERPFVEAAKASGAGSGRIISKHIFPNIVSLTYVNLALAVPGAILTEAALAFLGLSDPGVVSWGNIFSDIRQAQALSLHPPPWWWVFPPGFSIALVSLSFVLIGYALDEIFNPRLRRRR